MKNLLLLVASLGLSFSVFAALETGSKAPDFTLDAALAGKVSKFSLHNALKDGPVVVYFYPSAYTAGCNVQAHEFSTKSDQFAAAGAQIVGVSLDSIERLKEFSSDPEYCADKLAVASDKNGDVARAFGLQVSDAVAGKTDSRGEVIEHGFAERTTFIVTPDGKVAAVVEGVSPKRNVEAALETVKTLKE